jgi:hypothetical protein
LEQALLGILSRAIAEFVFRRTNTNVFGPFEKKTKNFGKGEGEENI